ncbi:penicillin-binding protein activator [Acetobacter garciniae]
MTRAYSLLSGLFPQALAVNATLRKPGVAGTAPKGAVGRCEPIFRTLPGGTAVGKFASLGLACGLLAACAEQSTTPGAPGAAAPPVTAVTASHKVGVLLPMSGPNAALGRELLAGAQLALADNTAIQVDLHDTAAAGGAAAAATAAVQAGDGVLLGPLTSGDTVLAAPAGVGAGVPVLAFTSDVAQARPGVWVMGITPEDQVQRLVEQARHDGRQHFAALLPNTPLGKALGNGLQAACRDQGLGEPAIVYHGGTPASIADAMRQLSAYDARLAAARQTTQAPAAPTPVAPAVPLTGSANRAATLPPDLAVALNANGPQQPPTPSSAAPAETNVTLGNPPFDALLLGDTGLNLKTVITELNTAQVSLPAVRIMGPGLWSAFATKLGSIRGAWYAAPDPAWRQGFVSRFMAQHQHAPRPLADLSFDAASAVRAAAQGSSGVFARDVLTRPTGFPGVDGTFTLLPDGRVRRALGVFEVLGNGAEARMLSMPAPGSATSG